MYPPGSSFLVDTDTPDIHINGNVELVTADYITINSMDDLTQSVQDGRLTIRTYDSSGTTTVLDRITYPVFGVPSGLLDGTDTAVSGRSMAITHAAGTTGTISLTVGDTFASNLVWSNRPQRTRGRSVVRRNHRGLLPRAVNVDFSTATPEEITALQLLRGLVGQEEFRRYLKYGFIMVTGRSGLRYQIKRGRHVIDVWNERGRVDGICVYLQGQYPPTDDTITRMLMAERDELELWRRGNSSLGRNATLEDLARLYGQAVAA